MKNLLNNLLTGILVVCALLVTAAVTRKEFFPPQPEPREPREIPTWRELARAGQARGPATAPVTIVEFSDFQCPFCARARIAVDALEERYPGKVRLVFRHFPLDRIHPYARAAANASECAAQQGSFTPFRKAVFNQQGLIGTKPWGEFAREAGVADLAAFDACVTENRFAARVEADFSAGERIDLTGTPSIIVNNTLLPGTPTLDQLDAYVRAAMGDSTGLARLAPSR